VAAASLRVDLQVVILTRQRVYEIIEKSKDGDRANAVFDWFLMILICLNVVAVISGQLMNSRPGTINSLPILNTFPLLFLPLSICSGCGPRRTNFLRHKNRLSLRIYVTFFPLWE